MLRTEACRGHSEAKATVWDLVLPRHVRGMAAGQERDRVLEHLPEAGGLGRLRPREAGLACLRSHRE